jgi:flagellar basal body rod protein FlgB
MNISSISSSALRVGQTRMDVTANNIANAMTPNFKEQNVVVSDNVNGGVNIDSIRPENNRNNAIENDLENNANLNTGINTSAENNFNDVSLEKQMVDLKQQEAYMALNAKVLKTSEQMLGSLIDTFA